MGSGRFLRHNLACCGAAGVALAVAGCQSGGALGGLTGGGQATTPPAVPEERITVQELLAYCPPVNLRESQAIHRSYQRGGDGDPAKLTIQATMMESTRSCTYGNGQIGMTVAVAGRVVPGPVAGPGSITLPIQVRVLEGTTVIHDQTFNHEVTLADTVGATQWVFTDSSFSMPQPSQANYNVYIGFAEQRTR